jgi:hypothetical protein
VTAGSSREPEIAIPAAGPNTSGVTFFRNGTLNRTDATPNPYQMYPPLTLTAGDVLRATWTDTAGQARESTHVVGSATTPTTAAAAPTTTGPAVTTTTAAVTTTTTTVTTTTTTTPPSAPMRYEAELAVITDGMDPNDNYWCPCSNKRAVGDFVRSSDSITWTINVPATGNAVLTWRYGAGNATVSRRLTVNGQALPNVSFPQTTGWANWRTASVTANLRVGTNTIRLAGPIGSTNYLNVDYIDISRP